MLDDLNGGVDRTTSRSGGFHFGLTNEGLGVNDLPVHIVELDDVVVHNA